MREISFEASSFLEGTAETPIVSGDGRVAQILPRPSFSPVAQNPTNYTCVRLLSVSVDMWDAFHRRDLCCRYEVRIETWPSGSDMFYESSGWH